MAIYNNRTMDQNAVSVSLDDSGYFLQPASINHTKQLFEWFRDPEAFTTWAGPRLDYPSTPEELHLNLSKSGYQFFALCDSGENVVAFGQFQLLPESLHLGRLAIHPDYRGKGLSYKLLNHLIYKASSLANFKAISLFVYRSNEVAIKSYQTFGFKEAPWPPHVKQMQDCLYMTMPYSIPAPCSAM
ncbi:MAG: GNAT family N-acetyltransferase [Pseudomonadota bacterium]